MNNIRQLMQKYFMGIGYINSLEEIVGMYNTAYNDNYAVDTLSVEQVIQLKKLQVNGNLVLNNEQLAAINWAFLFIINDNYMITDVLVECFNITGFMPQEILELLEKYSYRVECSQNMYNNVLEYIKSTYDYMKMDMSQSSFLDLIYNTLRMWQGQNFKVVLDFDAYFNAIRGGTQSKNDDSLRIQKVFKDNKEEKFDTSFNESLNQSFDSYKKKVISLIDNDVKQIIFTGAPGTGKTYLAKEIAKYYGKTENVNALAGRNYQLVQFHSSFDYTDFVEGLRPMESRDKVVEFRKVDGIFKEFCRKVEEENIKEIYSVESRLGNAKTFEEMYLRYVKKIIKTSYDGDYCNLNEDKVNYELRMKLKDFVTDDSLRMIEKTTFGQIADGNIDKFMQVHIDSNIKIFNPEILQTILESEESTKGIGDTLFELAPDGISLRWKYKDLSKKYFFVIDEINRADLSKVLGELMYCFEKDKRGPNNLVQTQYRNLVTYSCDKKRELAKFEDVFVEGFFIPENVVIIGTMNDIDRSVESMDFALRRRFIFEEFFVDFDNLMVAFTSPSFKFNPELSFKLSCSTCLLNKYLHIRGQQYGLNSHYDISQGQFSDANKKMIEEGALSVKKYVWEYRVKSLLREYLRGENETEVNNFIDDAMNVFYMDAIFDGTDFNSNIANASIFFNNLLNGKIKKDEVEKFYNELFEHKVINQTELYKKLMGE